MAFRGSGHVFRLFRPPPLITAVCRVYGFWGSPLHTAHMDPLHTGSAVHVLGAGGQVGRALRMWCSSAACEQFVFFSFFLISPRNSNRVIQQPICLKHEPSAEPFGFFGSKLSTFKTTAASLEGFDGLRGSVIGHLPLEG